MVAGEEEAKIGSYPNRFNFFPFETLMGMEYIFAVFLFFTLHQNAMSPIKHMQLICANPSYN